MDETIESIKDITKRTSKTILIYCTGHIISSILVKQFSNTNLFGLDVGLSLDWKLRDNTNEKSSGEWMKHHNTNEVELNKFQYNLQYKGIVERTFAQINLNHRLNMKSYDTGNT